MELDVSGGVSAVVLAAGANTRLAGIVAPFMKPLLLVNGKPLLTHALDYAKEHRAQRIIVASPENAKSLVAIAEDRDLRWVLQPHPLGVIDAIKRALPLVNRPITMVLCADNTFDAVTDSLHAPIDHAFFGARTDLSLTQMGRFTRYSLHCDQQITFWDPGEIANYEVTGCWIGPLFCSSSTLREAVERSQTMSFLLSQLDVKPFEMACEDVGVPEAL